MILDIDAAADAIVGHHGEDLALPDWRPVSAPSSTEPTAIEAAVRLACWRMGFDGADAQLLGRAWQRQSLRCGGFDAAHWPSDPQDFDIAPWPRSACFAPCPPALGLYVVVPDSTWVERMARAGAPTVQLRFKSDDPETIEKEVQASVAALRGTNTLLFINDHWEAAVRAGAYGVHLGQEDLQALTSDDLKRLRDSGTRLGLSTHGYAEMLHADRYSPSYLALGAVFATDLKRMATAPQGLGRLKRYARLMASYPLVAIGGISKERVDQVMASGVGSIAVVRAVLGAEHPEETARFLCARIQAQCRLTHRAEGPALT